MVSFLNGYLKGLESWKLMLMNPKKIRHQKQKFNSMFVGKGALLQREHH